MINNRLLQLHCLVTFILLTGCSVALGTPGPTSSVTPVPQSANSVSPSLSTASSSTQIALVSPSTVSTPQPVDVLPLDSEWRWNRQQSGECGYIVEAHNQVVGNVRLKEELFGYIERPSTPPLLITCANSPRNLYLIDSLNKTRFSINLPPERQVAPFAFALSPDQTEVAFATFLHSDFDQGAWEIRAVQLQSGTTRQLLDIMQAMNNSSVTWDWMRPLAWRSDGFFFLTQTSGSHTLWQAVWDSSEVRVLKVFTVELGESAVMDFTISTTTPWIAYRKGDVPHTTPVELRLLNVVTGEDRLIELGRGYDAFAFSQDGKYLAYRRTNQLQTQYAHNDMVMYEELAQYNIADDAIIVDSSSQVNPRIEFSAVNAAFNLPDNQIIYQPK